MMILKFLEDAEQSENWELPVVFESSPNASVRGLKVYPKPGRVSGHYLDADFSALKTMLKHKLISFDASTKAIRLNQKGRDVLWGVPLAQDAYYASLIELNVEQRLLLDTIFRHFAQTGAWPKYYRIGRELNQIDVEEVAKSLPSNYINSFAAYEANFNAGAFGKDAVLYVPALNRCEGAAPILDVFIKVLKLCLERHADRNNLQPQISSSDLTTVLALSNIDTLRLLSILENEPSILGGGVVSLDRLNWTKEISQYIRCYRAVETIEEYIAIRPNQDNIDVSAKADPLTSSSLYAAESQEKPVETNVPVKVFYSYSHADEALRKELETHLSALKRQGIISEWHDRKITAGTDWQNTIDKELETADIVLLLVSADFIASDYCYDIEMTRAIQKHDASEVCVIPIVVRAVDWKGAPFGSIQMLPTDARAC